MPVTQNILGTTVTLEHLNANEDIIGVGYKVGSTVKQLAEASAADVSINFNFANNTTGTPIGLVMVDGKLVNHNNTKAILRDSFCIQSDGTFYIGKPEKDTLHAAQGSPRLLDDGLFVVKASILRDETGTDIWANNAKHIRVAVGILSPTKAVIVRTHTAITLDLLAKIMANLGCTDALNGDGGGSAYLYPLDNGWGRLMGSAITVKKGVFKMIGDTNPTLIIDPGHGGSDPGASGNGIVEKNMVLDISLYQYKRFKELGVKVALTRDIDKTIDSTPRATLVANSKAKYCISNHINAATATTAKGAEIIHSIHNDGKLAKAIASSLAAAGQVLRPTATFSKAGSVGDYYFMHRQTGSVVTNIVEYGFLTNAEDVARLKANWQKFAEAVVKAFCEFIGHKYVAPVVTNTPDIPKTNNVATIIVNGKELSTKGKVENGVTMVPVRAVAEAFGASVKWDSTTSTVNINN